MNFHKTLIRDTIIIAIVIGCFGIIRKHLVDALNNLQYSNTCVATFEIDNSANFDGHTTDYYGRVLCDKIFNMHQYEICLNVPSDYYFENPEYFSRTQTFFNLLDYVNYTKIKYCTFGDDYVLTINKLNQNYMNSFWLIS
jgi:hypothetical protein